MPQAQLSRENVHVDAVLSNYVQRDYAPQDLIWNKVSPILPVNKESDIFYKRLTDKKRRNTLRAPGSPAGIIDVSFTTDNYFTEEYSQASILPDRIRKNADNILRLEQVKAEQAKDSVWLDLEMRVKELAEACSYTNAASAPWNSASLTPDPQLDVDTAVYNIMGRIGRRPNCIKLPVKAIFALDRYLKAAANITDLMSLTRRIGTLQELWDLEVIPVFNQYDIASPGDTESLVQIWTVTEAIVFYREQSPSLEAQGWMQTFAAQFDNGQYEMIRNWWKDDTRCDVYEYSIFAQPKICNSKAAEKITSLTE